MMTTKRRIFLRGLVIPMIKLMEKFLNVCGSQAAEKYLFIPATSVGW
jgi:hypothetical protein